MSILEDLHSRLGDRYSIERELGHGGMGAVYLARDLRLDRLVALKVLPAEYAVLPALRERFLRETRMAASFSHPNIVPVYAVEEAPDLLAYVMSYVEGESLGERVKRAGPLSIRDTVRLLQDVGYALAYAHGRGVVHRDIKPDNVMIERATGRALVMDFGIARVITAAPVDARREGLTRVGEVIGTPEYMSPEQASGDEVDGRSDLYSLGLTAHFALTGFPPMAGATTGKILAKQITERLPRLITLRPDAPPPLGDAIDRCIEKDPAARFNTAELLVDALDVAQLAQPDIPLAIRLFAQTVATLSMILVGGAVLSYVVYADAAENVSVIDAILPVLLMFGVLLTRVLQTVSDARRLAYAGFSPADVHRGFEAVVAEHEQHRAELRADPLTRRARRRTLAWGAGLVVASAAMWRGAFALRTTIGPHNHSITPFGVFLLLAGTITFGVGGVLVLRSPFRMPVSERLFRLVWLGPVGRAFVRLAGRGIRRRAAADIATPARPVMPSVSERKADVAVDRGVGADRVASLESRVTELERWRNSAAARTASDTYQR
jgi:hypothetical protein